MHDIFMLAALEQAQLRRGFCSPNPAVGAVAVVHHRIVAAATHQGAGTAHAELLLLEQLKGIEAPITLYVTLEPCNHWGQTPPCVDAIIARGITKVVYAHSDPNPLVSQNNTSALLQEQGIEVLHYPLAKITRFYQSYNYWMRYKRPWITVKIAQSLDGKIAQANGQPVAISNKQCANFTHEHRRQADIILTTAKTIMTDDPLFTARTRGKVFHKTLAIIDAQLSLTANSRAIKNAQHCHLFHSQDCTPSERIPNCSYHPIPSDAQGLDLDTLLSAIGRLGYHDVWVEAGGRLFNALHRNALVHRTYMYIAPVVLGDQAMSTFPGNERWDIDANVNWKSMGNNLIGRFDWTEPECLPV